MSSVFPIIFSLFISVFSVANVLALKKTATIIQLIMEIMQGHLRRAETQEVTPFTEVTNLLTSSSHPCAGPQEVTACKEIVVFTIDSKRIKTDEQRANSDFNF